MTEKIEIPLTNLKKEFPNFEKGWGDIVKTLGFDFIDFMKDRIKHDFSELKSFFDLQLSIVIDNNFIFGQIKNSVEKNRDIKETFIYKLTETKFVNIYAPYKLKNELFSKIETILNNNTVAKKYADLLLKKIHIDDAPWVEEWKKAANSIGHIDPDDVPYLALALHEKSHAIISNDKIFKKQGNSKSWNIYDTDQIISNYGSGLLSFFLVGGTLKIVDLFVSIIIAFFKIIADFIFYIFKVLANLSIESIEFLANKVPGWMYLSLLTLTVLSKKIRKGGKEFIRNAGNLINIIYKEFIELIKTLIQRINELLEALKPTAIVGLEILFYITRELGIMVEQIQKLESERAN
jgi:predicted nucleic acid-binding protein